MKNTALQRLIMLFFKLTDSSFKKTVFAAIIFLIMFGIRKSISRYKVKTNLHHDDSMITKIVIAQI